MVRDANRNRNRETGGDGDGDGDGDGMKWLTNRAGIPAVESKKKKSIQIVVSRSDRGLPNHRWVR